MSTTVYIWCYFYYYYYLQLTLLTVSFPTPLLQILLGPNFCYLTLLCLKKCYEALLRANRQVILGYMVFFTRFSQLTYDLGLSRLYLSTKQTHFVRIDKFLFSCLA